MAADQIMAKFRIQTVWTNAILLTGMIRVGVSEGTQPITHTQNYLCLGQFLLELLLIDRHISEFGDIDIISNTILINSRDLRLHCAIHRAEPIIANGPLFSADLAEVRLRDERVKPLAVIVTVLLRALLGHNHTFSEIGRAHV